MPATFSTTRLSRVALLAVTGATALSVAACGASNNAKPTSANPTSSAPSSSSPSASAKGKDWVNGLIDSVSGNTIQVSQRSGQVGGGEGAPRLPVEAEDLMQDVGAF